MEKRFPKFTLNGTGFELETFDDFSTVALSTERERHTENVFHIVLTQNDFIATQIKFCGMWI